MILKNIISSMQRIKWIWHLSCNDLIDAEIILLIFILSVLWMTQYQRIKYIPKQKLELPLYISFYKSLMNYIMGSSIIKTR